MYQRLQNEINHGKKIVAAAGKIWNWESPAGKERWRRRVRMLTAHITSKMLVLEVGCGTGYLTKELQETGASITAVDISPDLIEAARKKIESRNVRFFIEDAHSLRFDNSSFDTIIGSSILHHLDIDLALNEFFRILKDGGTILFTEPNMMNPQIAIQKNIAFIKERMGDSPNETAFFRWGLKRKLQEKGFKEISIRPFDFLHPKIPGKLIPIIKFLENHAESLPIISEIAGSLYIQAKR